MITNEALINQTALGIRESRNWISPIAKNPNRNSIKNSNCQVATNESTDLIEWSNVDESTDWIKMNYFGWKSKNEKTQKNRPKCNAWKIPTPSEFSNSNKQMATNDDNDVTQANDQNGRWIQLDADVTYGEWWMSGNWGWWKYTNQINGREMWSLQILPPPPQLSPIDQKSKEC